ncbi:MAG: dihydrofolate reductase family protein [Candidatus Cloacimonetes bacterium]|nr:dihydrofolate reductase family protein [Candidatus Cloacimonadota bacterium]
MARLVYATITSLDGFVEDTTGAFDWYAPNEEVHAFINQLQRAFGTHLYGRRMYEVMQFWEKLPPEDAHSPVMRDFAESWQAADKLVFSRTLDAVSTTKTQLVREFDPALIQRMKDELDKDMLIGGAELASCALAAGLVDEVQLFLAPVVVGGGKAAMVVSQRVGLVLEEERRFGDGVVFLRYRVTQS